MLEFNIVNMGGYNYRCVLDTESYFDFSVSQLELFGYEDFFGQLINSIGNPLYSVNSNKKIGEVVSIKYLKQDDEVWILVRNGIRGELYVKELG